MWTFSHHQRSLLGQNILIKISSPLSIMTFVPALTLEVKLALKSHIPVKAHLNGNIFHCHFFVENIHLLFIQLFNNADISTHIS